MRIFITGATGFIGQPLVRQFLRGKHKILILSRDTPRAKNLFGSSHKLSFVQGDLSNLAKWANSVRRFRPEACVHMAWEGIPDYGVSMSIKNLTYGLELFNLLIKSGIKKIVSTGSCWEYGINSGKLREEMGIKPKNAFSAAKNALHWLGAWIAKEHNIQFVWTRIFFAYGPGQKKTSLIPCLLNGKKFGEVPKLKNPNGANDFIYIDDVARALAMLIEKREPNQFSLYNIGSGALTKVKNIADFIYGEKRSIISYGGSGCYADIAKIKKEIGWAPKVNITDGVRKMLKYHR